MSTVSFVSAGSVSGLVNTLAARYAMPVADGGNPDLTVSNGSPCIAFVRFGGNVGDQPARCVGDQPGCVTIQPGQALMFTSNGLIAAAGAATGRVTNDGGAASASASFCVAGMLAGGAVTVTRGTASAAITF